MKFKPGDRVRCVVAYSILLRVGETYTIADEGDNGYVPTAALIPDDPPQVYIAGVPLSWYESRFELDSPQDFTNRDEGGIV